MTYWNFKTVDEFQEWMDNQPHDVRATIHEVMDQVKINPRLEPPSVKKLEDHVWELRAKVNRVRYRPLFCLGPGRGELTFLIGSTKTSNNKKTRFDPINAVKTAETRRNLIFVNRGYIREYSRRKK